MSVRPLPPEAGIPPRLVVDVPALTLQNARVTWEAGRAFLDGAEKIINLAAVKEVDSAALAILLEWQRENDELARNKNNNENNSSSVPGACLSLEAFPHNLFVLAELYNLDTALGFSS